VLQLYCSKKSDQGSERLVVVPISITDVEGIPLKKVTVALRSDRLLVLLGSLLVQYYIVL
jgi:hypothetical protein